MTQVVGISSGCFIFYYIISMMGKAIHVISKILIIVITKPNNCIVSKA